MKIPCWGDISKQSQDTQAAFMECSIQEQAGHRYDELNGHVTAASMLTKSTQVLNNACMNTSYMYRIRVAHLRDEGAYLSRAYHYV